MRVTQENLDALMARFDGLSPFVALLGLRDVRAEAEGLVMTAPFRPEFERLAGSGQVHGGVIASLIDVAGDIAVAVLVDGAVPTIDLRIDYLRAASGDLTARTRVRRLGRTLAVVDIDISDAAGRLIAVGRGCYGAVVDPSTKQEQSS